MSRGFTLVEVMITLVISGVLMTSVYMVFQSQQGSYKAQEQVAEMQQNLRAGLDIMTHELRMAGYKGEGGSSSGIQAAKGDAIVFSSDLNEDGDTSDAGENIGYDVYTSLTTGPFTLGRKSSPLPLTMVETPSGSGHYEITGHYPLAENIQNIEFYYTLDDGFQTTTPTAAQLENIRSIQISILAKTRNPDRNYTDSRTYPATPAGTTWGPYNDHFRRRFQIMTVKCRNMGL